MFIRKHFCPFWVFLLVSKPKLILIMSLTYLSCLIKISSKYYQKKSVKVHIYFRVHITFTTLDKSLFWNTRHGTQLPKKVLKFVTRTITIDTKTGVTDTETTLDPPLGSINKSMTLAQVPLFGWAGMLSSLVKIWYTSTSSISG